ncbi:hypothetical protein QBC46DRAFT_401943, partial [Diplogelasinospora grovesii]
IANIDKRSILDTSGKKPLNLCAGGHLDPRDCECEAKQCKFVVCHACWMVIPASLLNKHLEEEHDNFCKICEDIVKGNLMTHTRTHAIESCERCQSRTSVANLVRHIQYQHIRCRLCQSELDRDTFLSHLTTVHLLDNQHAYCPANTLAFQDYLAEHSWNICSLPDCGQIIYEGRLPDHVFSHRH